MQYIGYGNKREVIMKKTKSIFAISTILLGVLSPSVFAIADTLSSSSGDSIPQTSVSNSNSSETSSSSLSTTADEEPIDSWMPDKALQTVISQQLNIPVEDLTKQDMLKLTSLSFSISPNKGIVSLNGMEYATNLAGDVDLNYNSISDISPLYSTKITYLRLAGNNISDVSQFLNMPYLTTLVVPENHIRDLSSLLGSQYTTIIATDQTITLPTQEVFSNQAVTDFSGVKRPGGALLEEFTGVTSYDQNTDTLTWQLDGSQPENVYANWNDTAWIRANYNQLGASTVGFSGKIVQPLTYKADVAADVTVNYVDENNTPIHTPQVISGSVGEAYDATTEDYQLSIPGYFLDNNNLPTNAKGILSDQPQTVTYVYLKDQRKVNVHDSTIYVGDEWSAQDNFDSATDKDGNPVDFSQVTVDDSKADTTKAGTFDVTYTYDGVTSTATVTVKDKVSPKPTPEIPKDDGNTTDLPKSSNNVTSSTSGKTVAHVNDDKVSEHKSRKSLPQTGASNGLYLTLVGLAVLVGIVLTFSLKNKPRRK